MGGVAAAYLATLALVSGRWFKQAGQAPPPVALGGASLIYGACGIIAAGNEKFAATLAWAFFLGAVFSPELSTTVKGIGAVYGDPNINSNIDTGTVVPKSQLSTVPSGIGSSFLRSHGG